ncbi:uncharacterized protein LOC110992981 [Pieris rapae]|uniref:uncharacterized protein LOC110992981 n=1 Tax=Pieris rapae TaxID=64459 RepID=UPI001E27EBAF|nr:uncharacterized protein LOC110992981 [Pieris rapae]XP_045484623.1 uncharacterized protein LOC110992981 [Pieris rapae]
MCYNGKCLHCIEVETGSLIWAILNVILTGLACMICIGVSIYINVMAQDIHFQEPMNDYTVVAVGVSNLILMVALTFSAIEFMFTMFLLVGVIKKHVGYVKAYFVYGMVKIIIGSFGLIGVFVNISSCPALFVVVLVYVFHCLVLLMVRNTYLKFNEGSIIHQFMHKPLV